MKKLILPFLLAFLSINLFSQTMIREADWTIGSAKALDDGKQIVRTNGDNMNKSITNITYQSADAMIVRVKADAKKGDWLKSKLNSKLKEYQTRAPGGMLQLYIEREDETGANSSNFTVEVKKGDSSIQTKTMRNKAGKSSRGIYKNEGLMWLRTPIEVPFQVYVKENDSETVYSFEVK